MAAELYQIVNNKNCYRIQEKRSCDLNDKLQLPFKQLLCDIDENAKYFN